MPILNYVFAALAATAAGLTNALAGGGTLITFPTLLAIGLAPISANITSTVALCPGFLGGSLAQANDLKGQKKRLWIVIPAAILGSLTGSILLLRTTEKLFTNLIPFIILLASTLIALQSPVRTWLTRRQEQGTAKSIPEAWIFLPVFLGAIYGGYFGAGFSVILLAVMGLLLNDSLTRLNAIKQVTAFSINFTAALLFVFSGKIVWSVAAVMMLGALLGGSLGGRLAGRIKPESLRRVVVTIGFAVGIIYLVKTFFLA